MCVADNIQRAEELAKEEEQPVINVQEDDSDVEDEADESEEADAESAMNACLE